MIHIFTIFHFSVQVLIATMKGRKNNIGQLCVYIQNSFSYHVDITEYCFLLLCYLSSEYIPLWRLEYSIKE